MTIPVFGDSSDSMRMWHGVADPDHDVVGGYPGVSALGVTGARRSRSWQVVITGTRPGRLPPAAGFVGYSPRQSGSQDAGTAEQIEFFFSMTLSPIPFAR